MSDPKPLKGADYIQAPGTCPYCHKRNVYALTKEGPQYGAEAAFEATMECHDCGQTFIECWLMSGWKEDEDIVVPPDQFGPRDELTQGERIAVAEYENVVGKLVVLLEGATLNGYCDNDSVDIVLRTPLIVRIGTSERDEILRHVDEFIDPHWNIAECIPANHPQIEKLSSFYMEGHSHKVNIETGEIIEHDHRRDCLLLEEMIADVKLIDDMQSLAMLSSSLDPFFLMHKDKRIEAWKRSLNMREVLRELVKGVQPADFEKS
jgi:hypothetical protein